MTRKKTQPVVQPTDTQDNPVAPVETPVSQEQQQVPEVATGNVLKSGTFTTLSGATLIRN